MLDFTEIDFLVSTERFYQAAGREPSGHPPIITLRVNLAALSTEAQRVARGIGSTYRNDSRCHVILWYHQSQREYIRQYWGKRIPPSRPDETLDEYLAQLERIYGRELNGRPLLPWLWPALQLDESTEEYLECQVARMLECGEIVHVAAEPRDWDTRHPMRFLEGRVGIVCPMPIPEEYIDTIIEFLEANWSDESRVLYNQYEQFNVPQLKKRASLLNTPLAERLILIAQAAAGEIEHCDESSGLIELSIIDLEQFLFSPRGLRIRYGASEDFWNTPLGTMVAKGAMWVHHDDLITIKDAAEILGVTISTISQAVKVGRLTRYINPDTTNPQRGRTLVSRKEVISLK